MFSFGLFAMPKFFSIVFTSGSICSTMATFFLCGPKQQWKNMMKPYRAVISLVYLSSIIATVVIGIVLSDSSMLSSYWQLVSSVLWFGMLYPIFLLEENSVELA